MLSGLLLVWCFKIWRIKRWKTEDGGKTVLCLTCLPVFFYQVLKGLFTRKKQLLKIRWWGIRSRHYKWYDPGCSSIFRSLILADYIREGLWWWKPLAGLGVGGLLAFVVKLAPQQCTFSGLPHASTLALDLQPSQIPLSSKRWRWKEPVASLWLGWGRGGLNRVWLDLTNLMVNCLWFLSLSVCLSVWFIQLCVFFFLWPHKLQI